MSGLNHTAPAMAILAYFVRRDVYDTMGGIRPIALMEGYDFVRRLEAHGNTCFI